MMVIANARVSFSAGETIMRQGEPGDLAYIIESGRVEILLEKADGRLVSVGTRGRDTLIGEMALLDDAPRTATVVALEDCTLLEISKQDFSRRLEQADPVLRMTSQVILNRYRDMLSRAEITSPELAQPAESREISNVERQHVIECVRLTNELRDALEARELQLHYQPIVETCTGEVRGFEALLRWQHPTRGTVSPALFIPMAEASGLIVDISRWVLGEAAEALQRIQVATGRDGLFMSVNLSTVDFASPEIVARVGSVIERSGIEPGQLHLEITERMLMDQPERARGILDEFHQRGVQIAIDDFGTGYSSLSYLHSLPIDVLKIDRSFVSAMLEEPRSLALVGAIVGLSQKLGIKIIAEGVEQREQAMALGELGCDLSQGYYFAKPLAECEAIDRFGQGNAAGGWPAVGCSMSRPAFSRRLAK